LSAEARSWCRPWCEPRYRWLLYDLPPADGGLPANAATPPGANDEQQPGSRQ
jgi:hypothetical protein